MAVTVTYSFEKVKNLDLASGPARSGADVTELANGGFAAVGSTASVNTLDVFNAGLVRTSGATNMLFGQSHVDQLSNGNLVVATHQNGASQDAGYVSILNSGGGTVLAPQLAYISNPAVRVPNVVAALTGGGFVLAGDSGSGIELRLYNNNGVFLANKFAATSTSRPLDSLAITAMDNGGFAVGWAEDNIGDLTIKTESFDFDGTTRGIVPSWIWEKSARGAGIDMIATNGGFTIVYDEGAIDGSGSAVRLRQYQFDGQHFNDGVILSSRSAAGHGQQIARLPDGMIAVALDYSLVGPNDSDMFVGVYNPATQSFVAQHTATGGESSLDDIDTPTIAASGGRLALFHTNRTDNDIDGEHLNAVKTHTGDGANDFMNASAFNEVFLGGGGADEVNYSSLDFGVTVNMALTGAQIVGGGKTDRLSGIENLYGTFYADTLIGNESANKLDGSNGVDSLRGGRGNDVYVAREQPDQIVELAGQGTDTVYTNWRTFSLAAVANVENLTYEAVMFNDWNFIGTGNSLDNVITSEQDFSTFGEDSLRGLGGRDTIRSGPKNDFIDGGDGDDFLLDGGWGDDTVNGGNGNDQIEGGLDRDRVYGGAGIDRIFGGAASDIWLGGDAGNDQVYGGDGQDRIDGGTENDQLLGEFEIDTITGGAGDDVIYGGLELFGEGDFLYGEAGIDRIYGEQGNDRIDGGADSDAWLGGDFGIDYITGGLGNDRIDGGADNDTWLGGDAGIDIIYGGDGDDRIDGGADNDTFLGGDAGIDTVTGGLGNDRVDGGVDNDVLYGGAGIDTITGGDGADTVNGGDQSDYLYGGAGIDTITGGDGADTVNGGDQSDYLYGGAGIDTFIGGGGGDFITSGDGDDSAYGGDGLDVLNGQAGRDRLHGGLDNDDLYGGEEVGAGDTWLAGEAGTDYIVAGGGNDRMEGGTENDELWGGLGLDTSNGGAGADYFDYRSVAEGGAGEQIGDWQGGIDTLLIDVSGFGGGLVAGPLAANRLVIGTAATQAFGQFLYNTANGVLYWDINGTGAGGLNFLVKLYTATFGPPPASLATTDFEIVA